MQHTKRNPKLLEYRTIILPNGRGVIFHRLTNAVMGICGTVDNVGCLHVVSHYKFYTVDDGKLTKKVRRV